MDWFSRDQVRSGKVKVIPSEQWNCLEYIEHQTILREAIEYSFYMDLWTGGFRYL